MSSKKLNIAVIFGGRSGEHEVSLVSADSIIKNLYNVIPVGITKQGQWIAGKNSLQLLKNREIPKALRATLTPDTGKKSLVVTGGKEVQAVSNKLSAKEINIVFPV